ncbi:HNH endonuclease signature motif containing protein (plasmid) [Deinococcus radiomollis]|uniref:HNH endonuclease n=1 Tax=Deinococcus radiomollis TaxID=468916 RepID=UPI0038917385
MPIGMTKRLRILKRDGGCCFYCGRQLHTDFPEELTNTMSRAHPGMESYLHMDHVHPQRDGGWHDEDNLVASCRACNSSKGSKSMEEYRAYLERQHPVVRAIAALKLVLNLVDLPQDDDFFDAIELLEARDTRIVFPGETYRNAMSEKEGVSE